MRIEIKKACRWRNVRSWTRKFPVTRGIETFAFINCWPSNRISDVISAKIKKWVISTLLTEMTDFPPLNSLPFHLIACERQTFLLAHRRWRTFLEEERLRLSDRNFHTDDVKSARNPVRSANWWTDCCFSYRIYYVNRLIYVISMEFLSRIRRRTSFSGDEREETSVVRRLFI